MPDVNMGGKIPTATEKALKQTESTLKSADNAILLSRELLKKMRSAYEKNQQQS